MKYTRLIALLCCVLTHYVYAQNEESQAFSMSYQFEYSKDYVNAIKALDNVYDAGSYAVNLRLGWLHYSAGDYVKSQAYYQKAVDAEPNAVEAKLGLVYPLAALENWEEVIRTYKGIIKDDPNHYTANSRMAEIHFYRKDFEQAKRYASRLLELYPFDYTLNVLLARINVGLGNITAAKENLNQALLYDPTSIEVTQLLNSF